MSCPTRLMRRLRGLERVVVENQRHLLAQGTHVRLRHVVRNHQAGRHLRRAVAHRQAGQLLPQQHDDQHQDRQGQEPRRGLQAQHPNFPGAEQIRQFPFHLIPSARQSSLQSAATGE